MQLDIAVSPPASFTVELVRSPWDIADNMNETICQGVKHFFCLSPLLEITLVQHSVYKARPHLVMTVFYNP